MLWSTNQLLPNNYFAASVQLKSLEKSLEKDLELKTRFQKTIDEYLAHGYIVEVPAYDGTNRSSREWYLPHHPVVNPLKPDKVRRVLNGASKCHKQSLNRALLTGPDLFQNLLHVFIRFREFRFAVSADAVLPSDQPSH